MKLNLANPIVFFDLETTGINIAKDRIVEISVLKVYPNGKEEQKTIRVNPGMHIPEEASAIHGIYDEDVKDAPMFKHIARELAHYIEGCDLEDIIRIVSISPYWQKNFCVRRWISI